MIRKEKTATRKAGAKEKRGQSNSILLRYSESGRNSKQVRGIRKTICNLEKMQLRTTITTGEKTEREATQVSREID